MILDEILTLKLELEEYRENKKNKQDNTKENKKVIKKK